MSLTSIPYPNPPLTNATGQFVALHGWGANAQDLAGLAPYLRLNHYQYLFPNGPMPHPQVPGGRMWYDLETGAGLTEGREQLTRWLQSLAGVMPWEKTVLAGFSQGGAMTLDVGTHLPLAGLIVLSGYLHPLDVRSLPTTFPPILMVHGRQDMVVPLTAAQHARDTLLQAGATVQYHELDMGHEIQPQVLSLIHDFVRSLA